MGLIRNMCFLGLVFLMNGSLLLCMAQVSPSPSPSPSSQPLEYTFVLMETNFTRLCSTKSMLTVNGMFPGPEIRVQNSDKVKVTVQNQGEYGVTIHWHGVRQPRNPWSDGPEYITQCLIQPGSNFTQEITFSEEEEGTLWWHAHSDWSRATVHGAIIIKPADGIYPYDIQPDGEQTIVLASWYKEDVMEVYEMATNATEPDPSDAFTINGLVGDLYSDLFSCPNDTAFIMPVESGKTYLLRIVNAVLNEEMFFSIANHTLRVVGMDGAYLEPIEADYIMITPGNTMDVLVTANQNASRYYMAASPYFSGQATFDNTTTTAILQYNGIDNSTTPIFPNNTIPSYNDSDAAEAFTTQIRSPANAKSDVPQNITVRYYTTVSVHSLGNATLSDISFVLPSPNNILDAYTSNNSNGVYTDDFPTEPPYADTSSKGTKVIMVNHNDVVEIVFQGTELGAENHPMHLHGHSFYVVGRGSGNFSNNSTYNLIDPPLLNTVGVPKEGWAAIRFVANNPGVWFIHCHLERHTTWGMATALIVTNGNTTETSMLPRPDDMPSCSA